MRKSVAADRAWGLRMQSRAAGERSGACAGRTRRGACYAGPKSKAPLVVPLPKDQAELDRMILAGYTPHGNHLHPPGVKKCPLAKGSEAVM